MPGLLDALIIAMALLGMASIALTLHRSGAPVLGSKLKLGLGDGDGGVEAVIAGERRRAVVLTAREPLERGLDGEKIARALSSLGTPFTVSFTVAPLGKPRIMGMLERDLGRLEAAYSIVRAPSLKARLEFARRLYRLVASSKEPVLYGVSVTLWVKGSGDDVARAAKGILELETGAEWGVEEEPGLSEVLGLMYPAGEPPRATVPGWAPSGRGVVVGRTPEGRLVTLEWPSDFERHVGVVGPTGQGKTVLLAGLALQASLRQGVKVVAFDPKGDLAALLSRHGVVIEAARSPWLGDPGQPLPLEEVTVIDARGLDGGEAEDLLSSIVDKLLRRGGAKLLVVDEAWRVPRAVEKAVRLGRSLGLYTVYATQSPRDVGPTVLSNTGVFIVFGGPWRGYREETAALGLEGFEIEAMPPGHAVLVRGYAAGRPVKVVVEAFHEMASVDVDESEKLLLKAGGEGENVVPAGGRVNAGAND